MGIYQDDSVKNLKFLNGNTDITASVKSGSFKCENILCDNQLRFGSCNAARAQFVTIEDLNLTGAQITVQYGNGSEMTNLGVYKVTYSSHIENSEEVNVTMYDTIKDFDVDVSGWYNALQFPITLQNFRNSLANHIGVTQKSANLTNDGIYIDRTLNPSKLNGMDVLGLIGELNGVFPHASEDGKLEWLSLGTASNTIQPEVVQGANGVIQKEYTTSPISKLVIRSEDGDVGVTVGSGANTYYVTANALVYGMGSAQLNVVATNLYNKIAGISYTPTRIYMKCDPTIPMGALLEFGDTQFYLLSRKSSGLLFDEIEADGNQYLKEDDSVESTIEQLRGKSNVLTRDIEQTTSRVDDIEEDYTTHTEFVQNAEAINIQLQQMQKQLDGEIELYNLDYVPTLQNYPAWNWTGMYANDGDDIPPEIRQNDPSKATYYASDDLHFLYLNTELQKHLRTIAYNEETSVTYRFVKIDGQYVWQEVADTETAIILSRLTSVEATAEGVRSEVSELSTTLEDLYWTTAETQSAINQKADEISLSVSGTYATKDTTNNLKASIDLKLNKTDLISEINASANVITLNSNRLVVNSDNFKLDKNGNVNANNANLSGKFVTTGSGVFDFGSEDLERIKAYIQGTGTLNNVQLVAYDFNCDGRVDAMDFVYLKNHIVRGTPWQTPQYVWHSYPITVTIDASNAEQTIKIVGKDNCGVEHTYSIGSGGAEFSSVKASYGRYGVVSVQNELSVAGNDYAPTTVNIGGVNYEVLARRV